jgi:putative endonuclease
MEDNVNRRLELGRIGEEITCGMLRDMGHTILERNWRSGHLEIDIISFGPDGIHFVEVKTRRDSIQAPPQLNVDRRKQLHITRAALSFLNSRRGIPYGSHECFFDVMAITFQGEGHTAEWFPQAYIPLYV